jgi:apolipoprotein N-acyltransferase
MQMVDAIFGFLNYVTTHVPWELIGASGILSPLMIGVKKWFSVQNELVMFLLVFGTATLAAAVNWLLHTQSHDPNVILVQAALLTVMAQPFYFGLFKPLFKWLGGQLSKAAAYDQQLKAAAEPAGGLPASTVQPSTSPTDFSH